ncbi:hypothetical protein SDJN02_16433, partial [Cucurbita argyrosperma subsp. argyrosperma]
MAAEESGEFLHVPIAFRALEILRNSPGGVWKFEAATRMSNALKFVVMILESYVETLIGGLGSRSSAFPNWILENSMLSIRVQKNQIMDQNICLRITCSVWFITNEETVRFKAKILWNIQNFKFLCLIV